MTDKELRAFLEQLAQEREAEPVEEPEEELLEEPDEEPWEEPDEEPWEEPDEDFLEEPAEEPDTTPPQLLRPRTPRKADLAVGVLMLLLACIGIASIARGIGGIVLRGRERTQHTIEQCMLPLVLMDKTDFADPDELTDTEFLTAAVFAVLTDGTAADSPETNGFFSLSAAELTAAGNQLFGTARQPVHQTIALTDTVRFYYDAAQDSYLIPVRPAYHGSLPQLTAVRKEQDSLCAEAVCHAGAPAWLPAEETAVKTIICTLQREGDRYIVRAMQTAS